PFGKVWGMGKKLVGVNTEVRQVSTKRSQPNPGIGVVIAFSQLEEAPKRRQGSQASLHGIPGQRVQYHVHASTAREAPHLVYEVEIAGRQHMVRSHAPEEIPFFLGAGGGDGASSQPTCNLERREADAAGTAMDEK